MFTNNGTIFDNVRAEKIEEAHIPEDEIFEKTKKISVNHDKFNYNMIVDDHKIPSFKFVMDNSLNDFYEFPDIVCLKILNININTPIYQLQNI